MYSKHHLLVSVAVAAGLLSVAPDGTTGGLSAVAVVGYAAAVGVGIDLDHFPIAWFNSGEPRAIRRAVADPRRVVVSQEELFADGEVSKLERLLSHVVLTGVAVALAWSWAPFLGVVTAAVLYAHVLADLAWDVYRVRRGTDER